MLGHFIMIKLHALVDYQLSGSLGNFHTATCLPPHFVPQIFLQNSPYKHRLNFP